MNAIVGTHDIVLLTLDTLRYDVAARAASEGRLPHLGRLLPGGAWEKRHTPGSFTWSAHQAFFAGFLPTPVAPGPHHRLFAVAFEGSETIGPQTAVVDGPNIVTGLASRGYHTICVGGVGFFNRQNELGRVLPDLFHEAHWSPELGVTAPDSTENQFVLAARCLSALPSDQRVFLFVNVSALHQPNYFYRDDHPVDDPVSQAAALRYVDSCLPILLEALAARGDSFWIVCSDHGTCYGEDGITGHRVAHEAVWTVPYAELLLPGNRG